MIVKALARLSDLAPQPQPAEGVTYAAKIDKAEARIDFTRPDIEVDRLIRGLSPFPGAWIEVAGERVKLLGSSLANGQGVPGQVLHGFTLACGEGAVQVTVAQREGKRPMPAAEVLRGLVLPDRL
jgi:methionyl-tRNA formyltransferase